MADAITAHRNEGGKTVPDMNPVNSASEAVNNDATIVTPTEDPDVVEIQPTETQDSQQDGVNDMVDEEMVSSGSDDDDSDESSSEDNEVTPVKDNKKVAKIVDGREALTHAKRECRHDKYLYEEVKECIARYYEDYDGGRSAAQQPYLRRYKDAIMKCHRNFINDEPNWSQGLPGKAVILTLRYVNGGNKLNETIRGCLAAMGHADLAQVDNRSGNHGNNGNNRDLLKRIENLDKEIKILKSAAKKAENDDDPDTLNKRLHERFSAIDENLDSITEFRKSVKAKFVEIDDLLRAKVTMRQVTHALAPVISDLDETKKAVVDINDVLDENLNEPTDKPASKAKSGHTSTNLPTKAKKRWLSDKRTDMSEPPAKKTKTALTKSSATLSSSPATPKGNKGKEKETVVAKKKWNF